MDDLRGSLPDCRLLVFGDLYSQITLCVSSRDKYPQEQLDALCLTAGNLLDGPVARSVASAVGVPSGDAINQAFLLSPTHLHLFLRSPVDPADVLCCVLSLRADIEQATARARDALHLIARAQ